MGIKKNLSHWAWSGVSTLLLTACATLPEQSPEPAITVPDRWTTEVSDKAPDAWLESLQSPELEALVREALNNNPDIEAAVARFTEVVAEARIAKADQLPTLGPGLGGTRQQISQFGPTTTGGVIFNNYDLRLNLSWEIDLWGQLHDRKLAARALAQAGRAELEAARLSLVAQITKSWLNLIEARQQYELAEHSTQVFLNHQKSIETRFNRGLSEGLDLRTIRTQVASAQADIRTRRRALDQAKRNLEKILGRYPAGTIESVGPLPTLPEVISSGLPTQLIRRRPDLIAAERQLAAVEGERSAARKDLLPSLRLQASGGSSSRKFNELLDYNLRVWSLAGDLTQPIFQGGKIRANIERMTARRNQAVANYRAIVLRAFHEVESTLAAEIHLHAEQKKLSVAAKEAKAAEQLGWERYLNGTGDFLIALEAERSANLAQSRLLSIDHLILHNRIDLYLALGGSFKHEL